MDDVLRMTRAQPVHLVVLALIGLVVLVGMYSSDRFATPLNFANVQDQMVALALVALAQTIVILSGGIDLSYAGALGLLTVVFASIAGEDPASFAAAIAVVLSLGVFIGAVNGGIVTFVGIHPLIVT
ncbi:MAG: ABC transporter permease, partial [Hoeflea sp.]|nr:ABC transporter permease [Hoeflea sp.]